MATENESFQTLEDHARQLETLDALSQRFGQSLSRAFDAGTGSGKTLSGVLEEVSAALGKAVSSGLSTAATGGARSAGLSLSTMLGTLSFGGDALPFAKGGALAGGAVTPFAAGGIVAAPTYFPMANGLGLMGEAGPEAVLPLARGADGRLGVRAGEGGTATHVTVNIQASDVDSYRRSENQIAATLARAVARGQRAL